MNGGGPLEARALWYVAPGGELDMLRRGAILFGIGLIGMEFATIFTNALMPSLAEGDDIGRISGSGCTSCASSRTFTAEPCMPPIVPTGGA